jgi:hypothetical protein
MAVTLKKGSEVRLTRIGPTLRCVRAHSGQNRAKPLLDPDEVARRSLIALSMDYSGYIFDIKKT